MSLPDGVTTCLVTFGKAVGTLGAEAKIDGKVTQDRKLIHAASGVAIYPADEPINPADTGHEVSFRVAHVDQDGIKDAQGNDVTGWYYTFTGRVIFQSKTISVKKVFQVVEGQDTVDLDQLPDDGVPTPGFTAPSPAVLAVAGHTGFVTVDQLAAALGITTLPADLADLQSQVDAKETPAGAQDKADAAVLVAAADATTKANAAQAAAIAAAATDAQSKADAAEADAKAASIPLTQKGAASGVGTLDSSGKQPESQVPDRLSPSSLSTAFAPISAAFTADTLYKAHQLVTYSGSLYAAKVEFTSGAGFDEADWDLIAAPAAASTVTTVTANHVALNREIVQADTSGGVLTVTTPAASLGATFSVTKMDATPTFVIVAAGSGTIDGAGSLSLNLQNQGRTLLCDGTNWHVVSAYEPGALAEAAVVAGLFGDGSDGDHTVSGTETLTRDMFYKTLTVPSGAVLKTGNFRIFCSRLCDVQTGGTIQNNGADAAGTVATANGAVGTLNRGSTGGGGTSTTGGNGVNASGACLGGVGGVGGDGASGVGGQPGTATPATAAQGSLRELPQATLGLYLNAAGVTGVGAGSGGGSGGGDGTLGGAGGTGAGIVLINARRLNIDGTIQAKGGNGGNPTSGNRGSGGGGGGGLLLLNTAIRTGSTVLTAAVNCAGGQPGVKTGTGTNGAVGANGQIRENIWALPPF